MALIVILPFLLMCVLWKRRLRAWPETFLTAAVVWGAILGVLTEVLSQFDLLTPAALIIAWLIASVVVCLITRFVPQRQEPQAESRDRLARFVIVILTVLSGALAIIALVGPPNSFDSMTYHLPRVMHWIQDRNIEFYPVQSYPASLFPVEFFKAQQVRQLTMAPGAEFIVLNLQLAGGGERFAGLVQWFAYVGCLLGVWSLAELLGAAPRGRALAAMFAGTLPMACLQAVSTQNELVCAVWMICFIRLAFRLAL